MPHRLWYFIHVPKTAGATVRHYLDTELGPEEVLFVYPGPVPGARCRVLTQEQAAALPHAELARYRVIFGHYPFVADWFIHDQCRGLGFVRDPLARVRSWYRYQMALPAPQRQPSIRGLQGVLGLEELYRRAGGIQDLDNGIVRYFASRKVPFGAVDDALLRSAMDNVERHFDFVGHQGHFAASMQRIGDLLGRPYRDRGRLNTSRQADDDGALAASSAFLDRITAADRAFVDWIEQRYFG